MRPSVSFGVSGLFVLVGSLVFVACGGGGGGGGRPTDDDDMGMTGGTGPTGGTAGSGTGGSASGSGGSGGTSGTSGSGPSCVTPPDSCGTACTPVECEPVTPPQALITDFSNLENGLLFGAKDSTGAYIPNWYEPPNFFGGIFAYPVVPDMCSEDQTVPEFPLLSDACSGEWRITGTVGTYSGIGIWMETCFVDMSAYSGISLKIGGDVGPTGQVKLSIGSNANLAPDMCKTNKGTCTSGTCTAASTMVTVPATPEVVTIPFSDLTGGVPEDGLNPAEVTGIQIDFDCTDCEASPYELDLTIDDILLVE